MKHKKLIGGRRERNCYTYSRKLYIRFNVTEGQLLTGLTMPPRLPFQLLRIQFPIDILRSSQYIGSSVRNYFLESNLAITHTRLLEADGVTAVSVYILGRQHVIELIRSIIILGNLPKRRFSNFSLSCATATTSSPISLGAGPLKLLSQHL